MRPRLIDLFSGAGGAAKGYHDAGFDVFGVDITHQPNYPYDFAMLNALDVLATPSMLDEFDAIHASPPCQTFARVTAWRGNRDDHPDLLTPVLEALAGVRIPWIVENVPEAPLRADYLLCGTQFGLNVRRHRVFQRGNWDAFELLPTCHHHRRVLPFMHKGERAFADAMGCGWMTNREARQAVPPAYTEHVGAQLLSAMAVAS